MSVERAEIAVTFLFPDWFGEGEEWENYGAHTNWVRHTGNYAWDRLYKMLEQHGIQHKETCDHPEAKWMSVYVEENETPLMTNIMVIHNHLNGFILEEEKRREANSQNTPDSQD